MTMNEKPLHKYVEEHGQTETARRLDVSQGAVWQMLKSGRDITIVDNGDGSISAYEKKPIGGNKAVA